MTTPLAPEHEELPPLPPTAHRFEVAITRTGERIDYTADQMREYATAAVLAERERVKAAAECWCETCRPITMSDMRMVLCPMCGNKRCPRAADHRNACTGSNDPGQPGSSYPAAGTWRTSFVGMPEYRAEQAEKNRKMRDLLDGLANEKKRLSP